MQLYCVSECHNIAKSSVSFKAMYFGSNDYDA